MAETQPLPANVVSAEQLAANGQPLHEAFADIQDKAKRLAAINRFLQERHLKPLASIGDATDPKTGTELGRILSINEDAKNFYSVVKFDATFAGGKKGEYSIIFDANGDVSDGAVVIVRVNTKDGESRYLLSNQYRITQGKRMSELPRGGAKSTDTNAQNQRFAKSVDVTKLPGFTALREAAEEAGIKNVKGFENLGSVAQDSGTRRNIADVYLIEADSELGSQQLDASEFGLQVEVSKAGEIFGGVRDGSIFDNHTLAALMLGVTKDKQLAKEYGDFIRSATMQEPQKQFIDLSKTEQKKAA